MSDTDVVETFIEIMCRVRSERRYRDECRAGEDQQFWNVVRPSRRATPDEILNELTGHSYG